MDGGRKNRLGGQRHSRDCRANSALPSRRGTRKIELHHDHTGSGEGRRKPSDRSVAVDFAGAKTQKGVLAIRMAVKMDWQNVKEVSCDGKLIQHVFETAHQGGKPWVGKRGRKMVVG